MLETIRRFRPADTQDWIVILNHTRRIPVSFEFFKAREAARNPDEVPVRLVADVAGRVAAISQLAISPYMPAGVYRLDLIVAPDFRSRGIGSRILRQTELDALALRMRGLYCEANADSENSIKWLLERGFSIAVRRRESSLDLRNSALTKLESRADALSGNERLQLLPMSKATHLWPKLLPFLRDRLSETPDLQDLPAWSDEQLLDIFQRGRNARSDWVVTALIHGRIVGAAVMHSFGDDGYLYFVGVSPELRRLGVGGKLMAYLVAEACSAGCETIHIDNREDNLAALKLNKKLGFKPRNVRLELRKMLSYQPHVSQMG